MDKIVILIFALLLIAPAVLAGDDGPVAYLSEDIVGDYNQDGTNRTTLSMTGQVGIFVPNTADVLQYVRVNLTNSLWDLADMTTLVTNVTYRNYAESSGGITDRTLMLTNTSVDGTTSYNITNSDAARPLRLNATVLNYQGGPHIYSSDNIEDILWNIGNNTMMFWVTLTNPSSQNGINPVSLTIMLKNCTTDSNFNQTTEGSTVAGTASVVSQDENMATISVTGIEMAASSWLTLHFNVSIKQGVDLTGKAVQFDMDFYITDGDPATDSKTTDIGVVANYSNSTGTVSETTIAGLFARGPVSHGVEMAPSNAGLWSVRGFMENVGTGSPSLNYTIRSWNLFNVNETGDVNDTASDTGADLTISGTTYTALNTSDGRGYTDWYATGSSSKPYYAPEFVWDVKWNGTDDAHARTYYSRINSTMDFDVIKEIDLTTDKQIDVAGDFQFGQAGINIKVTEYVQHTGQSSLNTSKINIISEVPFETTGSSETVWEINTTSITVFYENYDADSNTTVDMNGTQDGAWNISVQPVGTPTDTDGWVNITINDLSATNVGVNMSVNDKLWLEYTVISPSTTASGDAWAFYGNSSLTTISSSGGLATPTREDNNGTLTSAEKKLVAYKTIRANSVSAPNNLTVTIVLNVTDGSDAGTGIEGIKFMDYIPRGTDFSTSKVYARFYNGTSTTWYDWNQGAGANYTAYLTGNATLSDGTFVDAYEYNNSLTTGGWTFMDGDTLWINYTFNVTDEGLYTLPTIFAAFDPVTGAEISARAFAAVVVALPKATLPLSISERDLELSQFISVEKPVSWRKDFVVYNPNLRSAPGEFSTAIFMDTLKVHVSYFDELGEVHIEAVKYEADETGRYITWKASLNPLETRNYIITALTPPVIETNKEVVGDVEELGGDTVKIKLDIFLRNTAEEDYKNVRLHLRTPYDKIEGVSEKGKSLNYWGSGEDTTIVEISEFAAGELKAIRVVYIGSYPIIIVKTDRDEYETGAPIGMSILVINGGEGVDKPYFQTEVYDPRGNMVRSIVTEGNSLKRLEKGELDQEFTIPTGAVTGLYAANVRFREDYAVLATGSANFQVRGVSETLQTLSYIVLIASTMVVLVFSYQRVRRIQVNAPKGSRK